MQQQELFRSSALITHSARNEFWKKSEWNERVDKKASPFSEVADVTAKQRGISFWATIDDKMEKRIKEIEYPPHGF